MPAKKTAKARNTGPCILIIDDDKDILDITRDFLEARGYEVVQAKTGKEALKKVKSAKPSLILLDVMLPKMDGFWLCRVIKADPSLSRTPVIFLTAKDDAQSRIEGQKCGGDDYVTKPFDLESLEVRIKAQLKKLSKDDLVEKIEDILDIPEPKGFLSKLDLDELSVLLDRLQEKVRHG
jgi:two-component system alkaline phosphatase synthesis response regulator PhoP